MATPVGYKQVEYIQSSGTQYIDTGYCQTTEKLKIITRFSLTEIQAWHALFGCEETNSGPWTLTPLVNGSSALTFYSGNSDQKGSIPVEADTVYSLTCQSDNGVLTYECGETAGTVNTEGPLCKTDSIYVFTINSARDDSILNQASKMRVFSFQIYDNDILVRDFVPCMSDTGDIGLYDLANGQFYGNAGTGVFTAGPVVGPIVGPVVGPTGHRTLLDETSYEITGGKTLIGGVAHKIAGGRTLVDGTLFDINFSHYIPDIPDTPDTPGTTDTTVGDVSVGSNVKMNVNGVATEFIVVHQGKPSDIYDNSCDGTWLMMNHCYEKRQWHTISRNYYETSSIHTYMNGTFLNLFDANVKALIKQVKIPYRKEGGTYGKTQQGANGLSAKIFLLCCSEVGMAGSYVDSGEGAVLTYFVGCQPSADDSRRVAYLDGSAVNWWLRSPRTKSETDVYASHFTGRMEYDSCNSTFALRPALILPSDAIVDENFNVIA